MTPHAHIFAAACFAALLCGCGSGYRATSKASLYSSFAPRIIVSQCAHTNGCAPAAAEAAHPRGSLDARADVRAPVVIIAEQLYISFWGGAAASNSVLSDLQIPLTGAP